MAEIKSGDATWHPSPKKPDFVAPAGAVDAHCHVFGPANKFPYAPERKYTPVDAPKEKLFALRDHLGFSKNVIVQASCHGKDNAALLDALRSSNNNARGVAVVSPDITDAELADMHDAGVRAVRFNFLKRLVDPAPKPVYTRMAERIAKLGWHVVVYFEEADREELVPFLKSLPITVVIDHMGRPNIEAGVDNPGFRSFLELMDDEKFWVKVGCPERLTIDGPPYNDVTPFARSLIKRAPNRVLWGTDWPHPNMKSHLPDDGLLVDRIPVIAQAEEEQTKLLIDNPLLLYWT
ncbi:UNVERIFIED_CONTAM: hypothetical protein GTU68_050804 [Idotea baltica]|nr:hypothetical protein [Idotea baltica]